MICRRAGQNLDLCTDFKIKREYFSAENIAATAPVSNPKMKGWSQSTIPYLFQVRFQCQLLDPASSKFVDHVVHTNAGVLKSRIAATDRHREGHVCDLLHKITVVEDTFWAVSQVVNQIVDVEQPGI